MKRRKIPFMLLALVFVFATAFPATAFAAGGNTINEVTAITPSPSNEAELVNEGKYTVGALENGQVMITANEELETYASSNTSQGEGQWVGVLIHTDEWLNNMEYSTDGETYHHLTDADDNEAASVGGGDGKTLVYWLKSEQIGAGKTLYLKGINGSAVQDQVTINFTPYEPVEITDVTGITTAADNEDELVNEGKYTVGALADGKVMITADEELTAYPSSVASQGEGQWVGVLIHANKLLTDLQYSTDGETYYPLTQADIDEAATIGGDDHSLVYWLKSEEIGDGKTLYLMDNGEVVTSVDILFTPYSEDGPEQPAPGEATTIPGNTEQTTIPAIGGSTPVEKIEPTPAITDSTGTDDQDDSEVKGDPADPDVNENDDDSASDDDSVLGEEAKTSDAANPMMFVIIMLAAAGLVTAVLVSRKMKRTN